MRTAADLLRGTAVLMVLYALLSPAYWPWYAVLPIAFLALVPRGAFLMLLVAMSLGSRLVAPLNSLYVDEVISRPTFFLLTWVGAVGLPVLAVLASRFATGWSRSPPAPGGGAAVPSSRDPAAA